MDDKPKPPALLPPPGAEGGPAPETSRLEQQVRELQRKVERQRETVQLWNDFQPKFIEFLKDLLEIQDNFGRAEEALRTGAARESVVEGLEAVQRQMLSALEKRDIRPFDPVGMEFHPSFHQIIDPPQAPAGAPLRVVEMLRPGYRIGEVVLRKAWVRVVDATDDTD